jgi:hypothetical protein
VLLRRAVPALCLDRIAVVVAVVICWQAWSVVGAAVAVPLLATTRVLLEGVDHPAAVLAVALLSSQPLASSTNESAVSALALYSCILYGLLALRVVA